MYFPTSSILIEFLILAIIDREDSYGYEISQTIKLVANIKESTLYPILKKNFRAFLENPILHLLRKTRLFYSSYKWIFILSPGTMP